MCVCTYIAEKEINGDKLIKLRRLNNNWNQHQTLPPPLPLMAFSDAISDGDSLGRLDTTCSCGWLSRGTRAQGVAVIYRGIMRMQRIYRELARKTVSDMTWLGISGGGLNGIIWNIHPNQNTNCSVGIDRQLVLHVPHWENSRKSSEQDRLRPLISSPTRMWTSPRMLVMVTGRVVVEKKRVQRPSS